MYQNSYMDFNDFINPIKTAVDDRINFHLTPSDTKIFRMYAKLNQASLNDDYLKIKSSVEKQFFSVDRVINDNAPSYGRIFDFSILMDPNRDLYQRSVFSILDLFGTIGGIFGLLTSACGFLLGFISTHIMLSSVFRRLYYTNKIDKSSYKICGIKESSQNIGPKLEERNEENKYCNTLCHSSSLSFSLCKINFKIKILVFVILPQLKHIMIKICLFCY